MAIDVWGGEATPLSFSYDFSIHDCCLIVYFWYWVKEGNEK